MFDRILRNFEISVQVSKVDKKNEIKVFKDMEAPLERSSELCELVATTYNDAALRPVIFVLDDVERQLIASTHQGCGISIRLIKARHSGDRALEIVVTARSLHPLWNQLLSYFLERIAKCAYNTSAPG